MDCSHLSKSIATKKTVILNVLEVAVRVYVFEVDHRRNTFTISKPVHVLGYRYFVVLTHHNGRLGLEQRIEPTNPNKSAYRQRDLCSKRGAVWLLDFLSATSKKPAH